MRRTWIVLAILSIVAAGVSAPRALNVSAAGHSHAVSDAQGNIYVSDRILNRIQKLSPTGQVLAVWD
jgi:hypothetical protein